jgi:sugar phosphate isomerase/epimerase
MQKERNVLNRRQLLAHTAKAAGMGVAITLLPQSFGESRSMGNETSPRFRYAICNETFGDWPLAKAFAFAAECGYRGIEIAPFTLATYVTEISAKRRGEIRRLAEHAGLDVVGLHWLLAKTQGLHLTTDDAAVRKKTAEYLGDLARCCADFGGKIMVLGSPQQRNLSKGMSREQGLQHAAEVLQAVIPVLEKTGVVIALEPLAASETNFLTTAADGVVLMDRVGSPHCRLHLDCKAMAAELAAAEADKSDVSSRPRSVSDLIHKYRDVFVHFHANDPNCQGPGFGRLDFVPIMKALGDIDYRGWISVEVFDYTPGVERLAKESIRNMKTCAEKAGITK